MSSKNNDPMAFINTASAYSLLATITWFSGAWVLWGIGVALMVLGGCFFFGMLMNVYAARTAARTMPIQAWSNPAPTAKNHWGEQPC